MSPKPKKIFLPQATFGSIVDKAVAGTIKQLIHYKKIRLDSAQMAALARRVSEHVKIKIDYPRLEKAILGQIPKPKDGADLVLSELMREDFAGQAAMLIPTPADGKDGKDYKLTRQDRADIAENVLSGLSLSKEDKAAIVAAVIDQPEFLKRSDFNKRIGVLMKFVEQNKGKVINAGISGRDMINDITKILGTDWQTGGGGGGAVSGPESSTDLAAAIWDGVSGELLKDTVLLIDPTTGNLSVPGNLEIRASGQLAVTIRPNDFIIQHTQESITEGIAAFKLAGGASIAKILRVFGDIIPHKIIRGGKSGTLVYSGSTVTWDMSDIQNSELTLTQNVTLLNMTNARPLTEYNLTVIQGGAGSFTITYDSLVVWTDSVPPILTPAPGSYDEIGFRVNSAGNRITGRRWAANTG